MSLGRAVPWASWSEWRQVGDWLFGNDDEPTSVRRGLDRVAAWRARGRLPLGVDSTALLVETRMSDVGGHFPESMLRAQYSMAVVRMVNGIADSSQKGKVAVSVASLASNAGLPRILVDLRHEATHNELPSLTALRLAAHHALGWLRSNYWERQEQQLGASKDRVASLVAEYIGSHVAAASKASAVARQGENSEDESGENAAAAACTPHPAVVAASAEYDAAAARRQRQTLINEMRSLVPQPAAGMLIDGVFPAERTAAAAAAVSAGREETEGSVIITTALRHALKHLEPEWPQLRVLLLEQLVSKDLAAKSTNALAERLNTWTTALLQDGSSNATVTALLERAAEELSSTAITSLTERIDPASSQDIAAATRFIEALLEKIKNPKVRSRYASLLKAAMGGITIENNNGATSTIFTTNTGLVSSIQDRVIENELEAQLGELEAAQRRQTEALARAAASRAPKRERETSQGPDRASPPRWVKSKRWQACAIGMLPSVIDPNGRMPSLDGDARE